ncbi:MAG TPA: hypothetical protein VE219_06075 [Candidatus Sulfotelmatobacter sp.]|nr:hypothetical protein [Candidatus Sulfotelmatobacter sp.]
MPSSRSKGSKRSGGQPRRQQLPPIAPRDRAEKRPPEEALEQAEPAEESTSVPEDVVEPETPADVEAAVTSDSEEEKHREGASRRRSAAAGPKSPPAREQKAEELPPPSATPWPRSSIAVMLAMVGFGSMVIAIIIQGFERTGSVGDAIVAAPVAPIWVIALAFIAGPLAQRITQAPRPIGIAERLVVAAVAVMLSLTLVSFIVGPGSQPSGSSSSTSSPSPSNRAGAQKATPTPSGARKSPSPSAQPGSGTLTLTSNQRTAFGFCDLAGYAATVYAYPFFHRLLFQQRRRPAPSSSKGSRGAGGKGGR